jgi:hypothetical protein
VGLVEERHESSTICRSFRAGIVHRSKGRCVAWWACPISSRATCLPRSG